MTNLKYALCCIDEEQDTITYMVFNVYDQVKIDQVWDLVIHDYEVHQGKYDLKKKKFFIDDCKDNEGNCMTSRLTSYGRTRVVLF
jgi:hypothetical protein